MKRAIQLGQRLRPQLKTAAMRAKKNHAPALRKSLRRMGLAFDLDIAQAGLTLRPHPEPGQFRHKTPCLGNGGANSLEMHARMRHIGPKLRSVARDKGPKY